METTVLYIKGHLIEVGNDYIDEKCRSQFNEVKRAVGVAKALNDFIKANPSKWGGIEIK